jgi:hypothetical protein
MNKNEMPSQSYEDNQGFDVESRDKVRSLLSESVIEILELTQSSFLNVDIQNQITAFYSELQNQILDDTIVERTWVTFDTNGEIVRSRSEDGVYDADNTIRYILSKFKSEFMGNLRWDGYDSEKVKKEISEIYTATVEIFQNKI